MNVNQRVRVLVVDDSEFYGTLVAGELSKRHDMDTERTTTASDALALLDAGQFDCVVSDYDMPGTNGIELFRQIRAEGYDLPFFLLTAAGSEAVASEAITAGIDDYFPKGSGDDQFEILGQRIGNVVTQRRTEKRLMRQRSLHGDLWQITQELVDATSRSEIAQQVCDGLVDADRFAFAWLTDGDEPLAAAGIESETLAAVREPLHETGLLTAALEDQRVSRTTVDTPAATDVVAIPLSHEQHSYGAVVAAVSASFQLTAGDEDAFSRLGTTVGHALAAVERKREAEIFRKAVEQADTAVLITSLSGSIEYANSAFESITGYDPVRVVGESVELLATEEFDEQYYQSLWDRVRAGKSIREEVLQQAADGRQFHVDLSVAPLRPDGDRIENIVIIASDITELKANEQRLQVLNRVLRHNLRNDLNVVKGYLSLAQDGEYERIEQADQKVDELLSLGEKARIANKAVGTTDRSSLSTVGLSELLADSVEDVLNRYPGAEVELAADASVKTRGATVRIAVDELLSNAIQHNDGNPAVRVETERTAAPAGVVFVDIVDNGPGIPKTEREALARGRETDLTHGSSLGLWLVHWTVTHVGGQLSIEQSGASGTTVRLSLPVVE